ncbi:MAG: hypothetical protein M1840_000694 [Geoglossum simile]|nr:MAG: hypothetical protein M1840_000694 [Geoglossum simile]
MSKHRKYFDDALKDKLDLLLYIDILGLFDAFFGEEDENPLYKEREGGSLRDWPEDASEKEVLKWFKEWVNMFLEFAKKRSTPKRKLDIGFTNGMKTSESFQYNWSQILISGELKSNPKVDRQRDTWLDLVRYARYVFTA